MLAIGASQYGATPGDEERSSYSLYDDAGKLLLVAPVNKPEWNVVTTYSGNSYIDSFNGTSAAAPMTAGVVALMLSINPSLTHTMIAGILKDTAEKVGGYSYMNGRHLEVGYGRINAYAAVNYTNDLFISPPTVPQNFQIGQHSLGNTSRPKLTWSANTEPDLAGYLIERRIDGGSWQIPLDGNVSANATSFIDYEIVIWQSANFQTAEYRMRAYDSQSMYSGYTAVQSIDFHIMFKQRSETSTAVLLPTAFGLEQNHPNPFNPATTIKYDLPEASSVSLIIYDITGRKVTSWINGSEQAGYKRKTWNGTDANGKRAPAGIYLYKMTAKSIESDHVFTKTRKMVLLK